MVVVAMDLKWSRQGYVPRDSYDFKTVLNIDLKFTSSFLMIFSFFLCMKSFILLTMISLNELTKIRSGIRYTLYVSCVNSCNPNGHTMLNLHLINVYSTPNVESTLNQPTLIQFLLNVVTC